MRLSDFPWYEGSVHDAAVGGFRDPWSDALPEDRLRKVWRKMSDDELRAGVRGRHDLRPFKPIGASGVALADQKPASALILEQEARGNETRRKEGRLGARAGAP